MVIPVYLLQKEIHIVILYLEEMIMDQIISNRLLMNLLKF